MCEFGWESTIIKGEMNGKISVQWKTPWERLTGRWCLGRIFATFLSSKGLSKEVIQENAGGPGTSLVAQWSRNSLPMQGTHVWALVQKDPTCRRATKPVCHNYWACTLEPTSHNYWAHVPQLLKPARLEPVLRNKRSHRNEKPVHHNKQ